MSSFANVNNNMSFYLAIGSTKNKMRANKALAQPTVATKPMGEVGGN